MNLKAGETTKEFNENMKSDIVVRNVRAWDNGGVTFDMEVRGITIYAMRVVSGQNGDFVSFPSRKGNDNKYYNHVYFPMDKELQDNILTKVSETWEEQQKTKK